MLDPQQLQVFHEVSRTGSYSEAARVLGCTQPAVSYQMKSLEREVGTPLTVRMGRTMQLTAAGTALLSHAERILAVHRAAQTDLASVSRSASSPVRLAAFPSSCATLVPAAMAEMRRTAPQVEVRLVQAEPVHARTLVRRGDVDLALCYRHAAGRTPTLDAAGSAGLEQREVLVEDMHLLLPMDHPSASQRLVCLDELADTTFVIASTQLEDHLHRAASALGFVPHVVRVADDYVAVQALVAAGFGVALVPDLAMRAHRDPRVVSRWLVDWPQRHVQVEVWPDMLRVEPVQALLDHLATASAALPRRRRG